jgi:alkanesulfonate monooxygenase SsuD/methylene tetrahydromethanopterin reductase-like flavin-dependent oxidoreductase (luciferase family)
MKLALFMMPVHNLGRDYNSTIKEDAEAIILADRLGYTEAWVGEHYSSATEAIPSPLMFLSSLIPRTTNIKLCTGVICLPQYHPATVAGQAALFDHLSDGRFIMGIGPGGLPSDFELFGTDTANRMEMVLESVDMIEHVWRENPPYDLAGKYWKLKIVKWVHEELGMGQMVKPLQRPGPPMAVAALSPNSFSMKVGASRGWIPMSSNCIPEHALRSHWLTYAAELKNTKKSVDPEIWHVARSVFVADTDEIAENFVKKRHGAFDFYFEHIFAIFQKAGMTGTVAWDGHPAETLTYTDMRDNFTIFGSPSTVTRKILELRESIGDFGTLVMCSHDWADRGPMIRSMDLMAKVVMPEVNSKL